MSKPIDQCKTVAELFADPTRWTQNSFARNAAGLPCYLLHTEATCFCFLGGMKRIYGDEYWRREGVPKKLDALKDDVGLCTLTLWNDNPETTAEQVRAMAEKHGL
jgi:hypothetical protein